MAVDVSEGAEVVDVEVGFLELADGAEELVGSMVEEVVGGMIEVVKVGTELEGIEIELEVNTIDVAVLVGSGTEAVLLREKKGIVYEVEFATVPLPVPVEYVGEVRFPVPLP